MQIPSITFLENGDKIRFEKAFKGQIWCVHRPVPEPATGCSKTRDIYGNEKCKYRGADKSLARSGRKQA